MDILIFWKRSNSRSTSSRRLWSITSSILRVWLQYIEYNLHEEHRWSTPFNDFIIVKCHSVRIQKLLSEQRRPSVCRQLKNVKEVSYWFSISRDRSDPSWDFSQMNGIQSSTFVLNSLLLVQMETVKKNELVGNATLLFWLKDLLMFLKWSALWQLDVFNKLRHTSICQQPSLWRVKSHADRTHDSSIVIDTVRLAFSKHRNLTCYVNVYLARYTILRVKYHVVTSSSKSLTTNLRYLRTCLCSDVSKSHGKYAECDR